MGFWELTHFISLLGYTYDVLIATFEIFAFFVILQFRFLVEKKVMNIRRFWKPEMKGWPKKDADIFFISSLC